MGISDRHDVPHICIEQGGGAGPRSQHACMSACLYVVCWMLFWMLFMIRFIESVFLPLISFVLSIRQDLFFRV